MSFSYLFSSDKKVYSGLYGADFISTETQYLTEGTHTITADAAQYEGKGFQLVDAAANTREVNVTKKMDNW